MPNSEFKQSILNSFLSSKSKDWRHCSVSVSIFSSISKDTYEDTIQCFLSNEEARIAFATTLLLFEARISHLMMTVDNGITLKTSKSQEKFLDTLSLFSLDIDIRKDSEEALNFTRSVRHYVKERFAEIGGIY